MLSILDCERKYGYDRASGQEENGDTFISDYQNFIFADGDRCPENPSLAHRAEAVAMGTQRRNPAEYCDAEGKPNDKLRKLCFEKLTSEPAAEDQPTCPAGHLTRRRYGPAATGYTSVTKNTGKVFSCSAACHIIYECIPEKSATASPALGR